MGQPLLKWWGRLNGLPGGKWAFSKLLSFMIPYTGSIQPRVLELAPGYVRVRIKDRRALRNHLHSIHAVAQLNLAEFCTGLAMTSQLSQNGRAIITGLSMEYRKKARGTLTGECRCPTISDAVSQSYEIVSLVHDEAGDVVSKGTAVWLVGPRSPEAPAGGKAEPSEP